MFFSDFHTFTTRFDSRCRLLPYFQERTRLLTRRPFITLFWIFWRIMKRCKRLTTLFHGGTGTFVLLQLGHLFNWIPGLFSVRYFPIILQRDALFAKTAHWPG